jgi:hypothetical protein
MGLLFARKPTAGRDPVAAAEADLAHKVAERRRINEQLTAARARVEAATAAHEKALLDDHDTAEILADERTDAQTQKSGLEGLLARIDVEISETSAELAVTRETAQRTAEADRLDAALLDQARAEAEFGPAANKLVASLEAMGVSETANALRVILEQARRQIEADRAAIQLRADNLRKPPPIHVPQQINPQPLGRPVPGSARPLPLEGRW